MSDVPERGASGAGDEADPAADAPGGLAGLAGLGGADGLGELLESAQQAFSAQAEAAQQVVEGRAGGGVVTVTMTGAGDVTSVALAREVVDPDDVEMLQDLIVAALRDAALQVTELQRRALGAFGGLDTGGLGEMFGGSPGGPDDAPGPGPGQG
jgi:nucleoid-associated protein EbfC